VTPLHILVVQMSAKICSKGKEMESCLSYRIGKCCDEDEMKKRKKP
jgi:hypothetical protein